ncbi:MAG: sigma-70 family RNA polymerase sigma factor [Deltaproteobacteria bacterium]|nr:sigma-70 family RNA polymerase sigma factor [Deltaproteobacteria bacterium]MBK8714135.1 sigma-70 family RNA polymerase sigma factor [Deltaproteobacteria bacterium]MBP7285611.1 sigma-70 family RNA polymerase sigma factor [Nannocystaceae bacterium]
MTALLEAFVAALPDTAVLDAAERLQLASMLPTIVAHARARWPELVLSDAAFVAHLAARMADEPSVVEQVGHVVAADLWLACACDRGDSRAIAAFEAAYAAELRAALRRLRDHALLPDDFMQALRHRLFVGDGETGPAIARYSGHGNLGAWVRVTAMRMALNATRNKPRPDRPAADADIFELEPSPDDPELDHLKHTYRDAFRQAFLETVAQLEAADRTLLRQSVVHGLTVRELARMHGVHHATIARRIAAARDELVAGTRRVLGERLAVSPRELDSIMMLIRSRLDVSLARALAPDE